MSQLMTIIYFNSESYRISLRTTPSTYQMKGHCTIVYSLQIGMFCTVPYKGLVRKCHVLLGTQTGCIYNKYFILIENIS